MSREKVVFQAESAETVTENIEDQISETARENSQTENGVFVKGMALPFGETSRNGVQYEKESVKEKADDLVGRPILFNHKQDYGTGHILNIEVTDEGMFYEGDINPNAEMPNGVSVAEAVERGDIRSPSIQAFIEQTGEEAEKSAVIDDMQTEKVRVADFIEISMVTVPGFPQASAMPEHLQRQGVKPITEALDIDENKVQENTQEETEEQEDSIKEKDTAKEQYEFAPVPTHVLYDDEEDAMQRARNLGLDDTHEHEMSGQIYYMAGDNHDEWLDAIERENPTDREDTRSEPFAGYDDFDDCVDQNSDKADPEAYCSVIKRKTEKAKQMAEDENDISEDDNSMTEQEEDNTEQEELKSEEFEQVSADDMYELVAGMHPQVEASDVSELLGEFDYDFNVNALVDFVAKVVDEETNTVMDKMADMAEGEMPDEDEPEEEGDYGDDDEDDMEEENTEEENEDNPEDKDKEELEEQVKEQSDKINELEERLETILDEDEGSSKQESPSGEGEESILNRRPSFKGLTDN